MSWGGGGKEEEIGWIEEERGGRVIQRFRGWSLGTLGAYCGLVGESYLF